ncbi:hypothetical protein [Azospirillum sp.]|uniref:hypothetical protein n=1 Tax=Azospirillum sp. TaxID=34012 RepID=UPI003D74D83E
MGVLTAALLLPVASVDADRCDELRKKVGRGAGLTNAEQNDYVACPNAPNRRPVTSLPKPRGEDPFAPKDPPPPEDPGAGRPPGGAGGSDGFL